MTQPSKTLVLVEVIQDFLVHSPTYVKAFQYGEQYVAFRRNTPTSIHMCYDILLPDIGRITKTHDLYVRELKEL